MGNEISAPSKRSSRPPCPGMIDPVSSLEGLGALIGRLYPTTHFLAITRGIFSKALGFADLQASFLPLILAAPVLIMLGTLLIRKQES